MISDFQLLSQKIDQLAELTQALRLENAELRMKVTALTADNAAAELSRRQAYQRLAALLDKIPQLPPQLPIHQE